MVFPPLPGHRCAANDVAYTSYSTLGGQWAHQPLEGSVPGLGRQSANPVFDSPVLRAIARDAAEGLPPGERPSEAALVAQVGRGGSGGLAREAARGLSGGS